MICKHCGSNEVIFKNKNSHIGAYCYNCDRWIKWVKPSEVDNYMTKEINIDNKDLINKNLIKIKDSQTISNTLYIVTEELGELIQAIQKYQRYLSGDKTLRNKSNKILDNLKEEIVDNYITVTQLAKIIEFDEIDFDSRVIEKTERTIKLLGIE